MAEFKPNTLYYGDNLEVLRDFPSECVDLVYLDPPFNSNRSYNVLFRETAGAEAEAQIEAFEDTWQWTTATAEVFDEVASRGDDVGRLLQAFVSALGHNDMMAYLTMMAPRLIELRRVMKPTASIYLHCDPTASHYLKTLMDAVFGVRNFRNEIIWKRTSAHSDARRYGRVHDVLLFFTNGRASNWNDVFHPYDEAYVEQYYRYEDEDGRRWMSGDLSAAGLSGGGYEYEWHGYTRVWRVPEETMRRLDAESRVFYTRTGFPRLKRYLDESRGLRASDVWSDIEAVRSWHRERLPYPTQKPEALLERIIEASSNPGDLVLDPFCGCGTATVAAHRLGRQWVGIDITYLAVDLMQHRLRDTFPDDFGEGVPVDGEPADEAAALALAERGKFQFQFWAVARLGGTARSGTPRMGPDQGIDGVTTFPERDPNDPESPTLQHKQVIISVKGGGTGVRDVRDLRGVVEREDAAIGVLVTARQPTRAMINEANAAGLYRSAWDDTTWPRIQLLTAGDIVRGTGIEMPSRRGMRQYPRAPRATEQADQGELI